MDETPIKDITDTAAWVATYRARETLRDDPLFKDPLAAVLTGEWGANIAAKNKTYGAEWYIIIRTAIIDDLIRTALAAGVDTIVNLGAGLDTRPYRLGLPKELLWIEVDYPRIIEIKNDKLKDQTADCRLERVSLDLADEALRRELFASIARRSKKALIITEGVLPYLTESQVTALAKDLRVHSTFALWIIDYFAPGSIRMLSRGKRREQMQNAPFIFNPKHWHEFFANCGWKLKTMKYTFVSAKEFGRSPPIPALVRALLMSLPNFLRRRITESSGFALLEIHN